MSCLMCTGTVQLWLMFVLGEQIKPPDACSSRKSAFFLWFSTQPSVHAYVHDTMPPQAAMHAASSFIEIQQQAIDL